MSMIGIIGGSGVYQLEGLKEVRELKIDTPYGEPSDTIVAGKLDGAQLFFLPRHGRGHRLLPSEVPFRANVYALKSLGVRWVVSITAVGSLREHIHPGDMVVADQFLDFTRTRATSFFGEGIVAHVSLAAPVCPTLAEQLVLTARARGATVHAGGTYVCIEGPHFSSRAESELYRSFGAHIIGMTAMPEAKLAREAELHYASLGLVTDYDCWHASGEAVTVEAVLETLRKNTSAVQGVLRAALPQIASLAEPATDPCASALAGAIQTERARIPHERIEALEAIAGKYLTTTSR